MAPVVATVLLLVLPSLAPAERPAWNKEETLEHDVAPISREGHVSLAVNSIGTAVRSGHADRHRIVLDSVEHVEAPFSMVEGPSLDVDALSLVEKTLQGSGSGAQFIGMGGMLGDAAKVLALCAVCAMVCKMLQVFLSSKRGDVRRCRLCGSLFLNLGCDEFETFETLVTIHKLQDAAKDGMLASKEYRVMISCNWSTLETTSTSDCTWDQVKTLQVPQGAFETEIALYSAGSWKDSKVASCILETKAEMLDKEGFFGAQQKLKLESKGKLVGTLLVTFRKKGEGGGIAGSVPLPISGVNEESALALAVQTAWEELREQPSFKKPAGEKLEGEWKLYLLSQVLSDDLRDVSERGKEQGKTYVTIICANYADLQGEHREEEMVKQQEKAKKKGLTALPKKWYWVWYEDKKSAKLYPNHPDGFIPLATITGAFKEPKRNDEFVIKYSTNGGSELLRYRRESGKGLEVWVDGIDLAFNEARSLVKQAKKDEEAFKKMTGLHQHWVQHRGMPKQQAEWKGWFDYLKQQGHDDATVGKFYRRIQQTPTPAGR